MALLSGGDARYLAHSVMRHGSVTYRPVSAIGYGCVLPALVLLPLGIGGGLLTALTLSPGQFQMTLAWRIVTWGIGVAFVLAAVLLPALFFQAGTVRIDVDDAAGTLTVVKPRWPFAAKRKALALSSVRGVVVEKLFDGDVSDRFALSLLVRVDGTTDERVHLGGGQTASTDHAGLHAAAEKIRALLPRQVGPT